MKTRSARICNAMRRGLLSLAVVLGWGMSPGPAQARDLWRLNEVFTDATGAVQFVELYSPASQENDLAGLIVAINGRALTLTANVTGDTRNRFYLIATSGFAAQSGGVAADFTLPAGFIPVGAALSVQIGTGPIQSLPAAPSDGVRSLDRTGTAFRNSPTGYAGTRGEVRRPVVSSSFDCTAARFELPVNSTQSGNIVLVLQRTPENQSRYTLATTRAAGAAVAGIADAAGIAMRYLTATCAPDVFDLRMTLVATTPTFTWDFVSSTPLARAPAPVPLVATPSTTRPVLVEGTVQGMWPNYAGNLSSNKYSPLSQINASNVNNLQVAWRWRSPDNDITGFIHAVFEGTPLMVDGVLYVSTSFGVVAAIDATTGVTRWTFDSFSRNFGTPPNNGFLHRGVSYWQAGADKRVFLSSTDGRLIALDANTGVRIPGFGNNGSISLLDGIPRLDAGSVSLGDAHNEPGIPRLQGGTRVQYGNSSPPAVCRDVLVVGSNIHDGQIVPPAPPGDVRGFDVRTGRLLWTFHTIPREGEPGTETWANESWRTNGAANVWAPMTVDERNGLVYLPVSAPTNNYFGARRIGNNLYGSSLVALDCQTGRRAWHFQTVHHDVWDYDLPAAPNVMDIRVSGRTIPAIAQVTKQGFVFVFNRITGAPVWPIPERLAPVSPAPVVFETLSPTQPIPSWPPPFCRQGVNPADLIAPESAAGIITGPLYLPPSYTTNGDGTGTPIATLTNPGEGGGANWGGASFDPVLRRFFVPSVGPLVFQMRLTFSQGANTLFLFPNFFTRPGATGPANISPFANESGTITAYDMDTGMIRWQVPNGPNGGVVSGAPVAISTATLVFASNRETRSLHVFNKDTGALLRSIDLGASNATGSPMTYLANGKQYVVIAVGRNSQLIELVALSLP